MNVVLFNKPLWLVTDRPEGDGPRIVCELYGFTFQNEQENLLKGYVEYLCGASIWQQAGNRVENLVFIDEETGDNCFLDKKSRKRFFRYAKRMLGLEYEIYRTGLDFNDFIVSPEVWKDIRKYGIRV